MKNKFFKILSLILSFGIIASNFPNISAGGGLSKPKKVSISPEMQQANDIICGTPDHRCFEYHPVYAEDGGKAYFWAWNKIRCKKGFDAFAAKYKNKVDNKTSAKTLSDSEQNENWKTMPMFGNNYALEFFEESREKNSSKYLLRIDEENNLIYTVRKSGDLYLFTFYLAACADYTNPKVCLSCFSVSSDMRNIKKILLPIDRELLN